MNSPEYMINPQGHHVPVDKIRPQEIMEDRLVFDLYHKAVDLHNSLKAFKIATLGEIQAFQQLLAEQYQVTRGGEKGNVTFTSYDGLTKAVVSNQDFIQFGPELQTAKALIDECIREWGKDSNDNIRTLINQAFRVDKNNRLNTQAILGLRRLDITDDAWQRAMKAISDSIRVHASKRYIRFYARASADENWESVSLDLASV